MSEAPQDAEPETRTEVSIRRAPRFSAFLVVGALFGLIVTLWLVSLFPADPAVGFGATFGFFVLYGVPAGALLGAILAIILDRRASRRAATVVAGKLSVRAEDGEHGPDDGELSGSGPDDSTQG
jgi:hypothetical protein